MPVKYRVLNDGNLVIERWSGRITHEEMMRSLMRRLHDPAIRQGASVLADGRMATFETDEEKAPVVADAHRLPDDRMKDSRVAMVVREDVLVRANLFADRAAEHGTKIMVFEHFDVACLWLEVNPTETNRVLDALAAEPEGEADSATA